MAKIIKEKRYIRTIETMGDNGKIYNLDEYGIFQDATVMGGPNRWVQVGSEMRYHGSPVNVIGDGKYDIITEGIKAKEVGA